MPEIKVTTLNGGARLLKALAEKADHDQDGKLTSHEASWVGTRVKGGAVAGRTLGVAIASARATGDQSVRGIKLAVEAARKRLVAADANRDGVLTAADQKKAAAL